MKLKKYAESILLFVDGDYTAFKNGVITLFGRLEFEV